MCFCCYGNLKFPLIYNGKSENRRLMLSHACYFDKSFLPNIWILSKPLMATKKDKFAKKYSKIIFLEAIRGMKLKLFRNGHNISLYNKYIFLLSLLMLFCCYGNIKFPLTYIDEKSESRSLLLSHCRYFDRTFYRRDRASLNYSFSILLVWRKMFKDERYAREKRVRNCFKYWSWTEQRWKESGVIWK